MNVIGFSNRSISAHIFRCLDVVVAFINQRINQSFVSLIEFVQSIVQMFLTTLNDT